MIQFEAIQLKARCDKMISLSNRNRGDLFEVANISLFNLVQPISIERNYIDNAKTWSADFPPFIKKTINVHCMNE